MNNHIDFDLSNVKINQFMNQQQQQSNKSSYELSAICIHIGENMGQGHYTSNLNINRNEVDVLFLNSV